MTLPCLCHSIVTSAHLVHYRPVRSSASNFHRGIVNFFYIRRRRSRVYVAVFLSGKTGIPPENAFPIVHLRTRDFLISCNVSFAIFLFRETRRTLPIYLVVSDSGPSRANADHSPSISITNAEDPVLVAVFQSGEPGNPPGIAFPIDQF